MDLFELIQNRRFLGDEFLMWLWFRSECFDGLMKLGDGRNIEVIFDDALTLEAYMAETERSDLKGGAPAFSAEARVSLRHGKRLSKAKLRLIMEGREWVFALKGESLSMSSLKLPALLTKDVFEQFWERMYLMEELEKLIEDLYGQFLALRLTPVWTEAMLPAMKEWIQADDAVSIDAYPALEGDR